MSIKKFSIKGLDFAANSQVLTTENLNQPVVITAISAVPALRGATGPAGAPGAAGQPGATGSFVGFTVRSTYANNQPYVTVSNVTTLEFDDDSGFAVTNRGAGNVLVAMNSTFKYWEVSGSQQLVATGLDHITIDSGNNIIITSNASAQPYQSIRFDTVSNPTFANVTAGAFFFANGEPLSGGAAATVISSNPPANPIIGQFWLKDDTGELYVYYNDGDSSQWITPTGSAGLPGPTGPAGSPGGATGATGVAGATGATGVAGATGATGVAGANGATGATGVAGADGATGIQGNIGPIGATGIQGNIGPIGATGIQGNIGPIGATGPEFLISVGDSPPGSPQSGSLWWDSAAGSLFFYYVDTDSSQWVSAAVAAAGVGGAGGTSLGSRTTATVSTSSIANSATANVSITGFKGYNLYKVQSSHAAWIRIYTSNAARTADSSRSQGTDPTPDVGIVTEVITNGAQTVVLAPAVVGFNDESPVTTSVPLAVTNLSGGANIVAVTITLVQTEA